jgi:hypothetical protein
MSDEIDIDDLLDRADDLGILDDVAEVLDQYVTAAEEAAEAYEANRGKAPEEPTIVTVTAAPAALWVLGELARIEYDRDESETPTRRYHDFEDERPQLAVDPASGQLHIVGGDYSVTARGIVG